MYSFKEKKRHFSDLKNTSAAESDLILLKSKVKQVISAWERQPKRYADDILYRLLDVATREEIRINRRVRMKGQEEMSFTGDETKEPVDNSVSLEESEIDVHDAPSPKSDDNDVQKRISEAEAAREEAEERAEEAESALEEAEERAEEAGQLLKKRKKKSRIQRAPHEKSEKAKARRVPANRLG